MGLCRVLVVSYFTFVIMAQVRYSSTRPGQVISLMSRFPSTLGTHFIDIEGMKDWANFAQIRRQILYRINSTIVCFLCIFFHYTNFFTPHYIHLALLMYLYFDLDLYNYLFSIKNINKWKKGQNKWNIHNLNKHKIVIWLLTVLFF